MFAKFFICFLLILPYISPVLSGDKDQYEYEYEYEYEEVPRKSVDWKKNTASKFQNVPYDESSDEDSQGVEADKGKPGNVQVCPGKKSKSSSKTITKTVTKKQTKSSVQRAEDPEEIVIEEEEPKRSSKTVKKTIITKSKSGKPADYEEEEEEEPEEVIVVKKEEKPKEVENKKKRVPGLLESAFCNQKKRCDPKCVQKLFEQKKRQGFLSFVTGVVAGAGEFLAFSTCYATFVGCNILTKLDLPIFKNCIIDWAGLANGKMSDCFEKVLCQAETSCIDTYEYCMEKACGNERWENFRKCAL